MYGLLSTPAMSSMRPPILAGPMPRNTKRFSIGSSDQLMGVGVGLGEGKAACAGRCAAGEAAGVCDGVGFWAWAASVPTANAQTETNSHFKSRIARNVSVMGNFLSIELLQMKPPMRGRA